MSSCGWVLRCSWDNGFCEITYQPQGAIPVGTAVAGRPRTDPYVRVNAYGSSVRSDGTHEVP